MVTQSGGSRFETCRTVPRPVLILLTLSYGKPSQMYAIARVPAEALIASNK
ncbi:MAG: hypothetical protein ACK4KV_10485 [Rhodocyclaceae bacterium]